MDYISEIHVPSGKIIVITGTATVSKLCAKRVGNVEQVCLCLTANPCLYLYWINYKEEGTDAEITQQKGDIMSFWENNSINTAQGTSLSMV